MNTCFVDLAPKQLIICQVSPCYIFLILVDALLVCMLEVFDNAGMPCPPVGLQPPLGAICKDTAFAAISTMAWSKLHHVMILNII
jgi:hypothetical protein